MIRLEEYITKRKTEDHLNEFDMEQKVSNIKKAIDYIFEYFDNYLPLEGAENHSAEDNERLNKYEKTLREYTPELSRWLMVIYDETGHQINKSIQQYCDNISGFLLTFEDSEFRLISYNCYAELIKKRPCLRNETERLYQFIKEYHAVVTKRGPLVAKSNQITLIKDISMNIIIKKGQIYLTSMGIMADLEASHF